MEESSFTWEKFVGEVFGVEGDLVAIENGMKHLKEIFKTCERHLDALLESSTTERIQELEASRAIEESDDEHSLDAMPLQSIQT